MIGPERRFYGYVTGLSVDPSEDLKSSRGLLVRFSYNGQSEVWRVPSFELFEQLEEAMSSNAYHFDQDGHPFGPSGKVDIWLDGDVWRAEAP